MIKDCEGVPLWGDFLHPEIYKPDQRMGLPYKLSDKQKESSVKLADGFIFKRINPYIKSIHVGIYDENGIFQYNEYEALRESIKYNDLDFIYILDKIVPRENVIYTSFSFAAKTTLNTGLDYSKFTYLMQDDSGLTKIGMSIDPERRKAELAKDFPTIRIVALCTNYCEKELHELFSSKRVVRNVKNRLRGSVEWFNLSESDILMIYRIYNFYDYNA